MADKFNKQEDWPGDGYALARSLVDLILISIETRDSNMLDALLEPLHPADIADALEQVSSSQRESLISLWSNFDGAILSELKESVREEIILSLAPQILKEAVRDLESDDVVDLIEDLEHSQKKLVLDALSDGERIAVEQSLGYPEFSAGRLMQREVVVAPEHWTVGDTIDYLRGSTSLPDQFYHIILVSPAYHPTGYVALGRLLSSNRKVRLVEILEKNFRTVPSFQDEEEVAYAFNQYHLISAPVVDYDDRLIGVITIDDAMSVLGEEAQEDILRLAGVSSDASISDNTFETVRQRFPWLAINLGTAILASVVISQFEIILTQIVALAILMPIIASMGGNAGTQSLTVAVRALATKDLTRSNLWRTVRREVVASLINGFIFAVFMSFIGMFWFGIPLLGFVIGVAIVINLAIAALAGILIPIGCERLGVDPALASGTFVTTVTDVVGFFVFLGLASLILI
ncbi:MAG: magnesium transporter [Proteobacteria bacterium]|jgi:magnesium transporter|nr:magnesium transporter [Pseudomonadota bacterium]MDA1237641.1 magnesium transporter [Pseudomonadota bacterium]